MLNISIIPNYEKAGVQDIINMLRMNFDKECNITVEKGCFEEKLSVCADAAVVLGGDGTILHAAKMCAESKTPILGINLGTMGYMTGADKGNAKEAFRQLLSGDYTVNMRMMLDISVIRDGMVLYKGSALNDGVIFRNVRLLHMSEYIGDQFVYSFAGDGIIISTPTGSTAYSLSAGGPVAPPDMQVMISTPVCPHSIHIRPVLVPADKQVKIVIKQLPEEEAALTVDGQNAMYLKEEDIVLFKKSVLEAGLISLKQLNFYDVLRYKLSVHDEEGIR
ncbi:MAG: NAD(+)/NADH kinase [Bacillota bacterium]|nr:NAD(+)/NADH kinase [Bacillota bacterium]